MDSVIKKKEKSPNPRVTANWLSAVTFWWVLPIFYRGYKHELQESDLPETLREHRSNLLGDRMEAAWMKELKNAKNNLKTPSLLKVILRVFGPILIGYGCIGAVLELVIKMAQPIALGNLVNYYSTNAEDRNENDAYIQAAILIISNFLSVLVFHPYFMGIIHIVLKLKVSIVSLVYRKSLRLSKTALGDTTVGQVVNLLSNDINRLNGAVMFCHDLWIGPLASIIVTVIMYQEIGIASVFGVCYIFCYLPFQGWLGKRSSVLRLRTALRTDERLRIMNEIINGIQVIKMYTWEKPFASLVELARRKEVSAIRSASYIRGVNLAFILFTTRTAIFTSILGYVLLGEKITAQKVFVVTCCFNVLKYTMTDFFPYGLAQVAEASVSVKRIQKFLLYEETKLITDYMNTEIKNGVNENGVEKIKDEHSVEKGVILKNVTAKWTPESTDNTLTNITLDVPPGKLLAVIGPVGSGKSSLLNVILKELPITEGSIQVDGSISYAAQEPWLFAGSVRQNILFGSPMDKNRYQRVIECCSLKRDFSLFPYGDKTIVGERGISLSGGQRARVNLARAVYKDASIYLLDDPLSAVDAHVGRQLFDNCVNGFLKNKTVILITHQLQYLKEADQIIIINNGMIEDKGTYRRLKSSGLDFAKLLDENDKQETQEEPEKQIVARRRSSVKSIGSYGSIDSTIDEPQEVKEHRSTGKISGSIYKAYLTAAGNIGTLIFVVFLFILSQIFCSASDYFVSYWVNLEEYHNKNNASVENGNTGEFNPIWDLDRESCIYIYSGLILLMIVITMIRSFVFFFIAMKASIHLHNNMFSSITRTTMRFFNTNTSGRILNRFSKDMGNIDDILPGTLIDCLQIGLTLIGIIAVVVIVDQWLIIPTIIIFIIFYFLRNIYLSTSRNFKRLEGITSSPVFGHLSASLQGLTTIRAFKAQRILEQEFDNHQDLYSTAFYYFHVASRTFAWWLDGFCIVYLSIVVISFFLIGNDQYGGNVGLAITQVMGMLGIVQWGIRQSSEMENQMTSVERVVEYTNLPKERPLESTEGKKPPKDWPSEGKIEFENIYLTYAENDPPVLKNLNFVIYPKEKIGIVGRTGAGKSSLIAALFQLTDTKGNIIIDKRNVTELGLHDLRSKLAIIPQDPVIFSGTLRKNLDPFDEYPDNVLWKALEDVELKNAVSDLTGGLNGKMSEGGSNLSVGQRQLVCLARAIIRQNKILVLDEATANVDPKTDALIQKTIRNKFADCTVLTIAHRLNTVMDSDRILVMDAGSCIEFDQPYKLLQKSDGVFKTMVDQTGPLAETLTRIAKENYKSEN